MSVSSSSSPERYCLGGLMKDIDKELSPRDFDFDSKDETSYKTIGEQKLSLDSLYSFTMTKTLFSPATDNILCQNISKNKENNTEFSFSSKEILSAFTSQKTTILLQKSLIGASKEVINNIIKEMKGYYSSVIKNKNGNYFCKDLFKLCNKEQRIEILKEISHTIIDDCIDEYGKAFSNVVFMGARSLKTALEGTGSKLWSVDGATIDILGSKWGKIYDEITAEDLQGIFESAEEFYDEEKDIDGEQFKAYLENARNCIYQSKVPIAKNVIEILESNIHSFEFLINKVSLIN